MKKNATLAAYLNCVAPEGLDLDRYVEHGGRLLSDADKTELTDGPADLRAKITALPAAHARLARQLELLLSFYEDNPPHQPGPVRHETIFALLYAAREMDLVPDEEPEVGYLDDAAVVESVLSRHPSVFGNHCGFHQLDWAAHKAQHHA